MEESKRGAGTCAKCGVEVRYVRTIRGFLWVHIDTGNWQSLTPERHDANTYVEIPRAKEVVA